MRRGKPRGLLYDHLFSICFSVKTPRRDGDVTRDEIIDGIERRLNELMEMDDDLVIEAVGPPEDTDIFTEEEW